MEIIVSLILLCVSGFLIYSKVIYPIMEANREAAAERLESYVSYDEKTQTLHLYKFHPDIEKVVKMSRYELIHTRYQPETITFSAVTVGNVTTGGVSKNEAYKYISGTSGTDRFMLEYRNKTIKTIKLYSPEVKNLAKQRGMDKYMNSNGDIIVVHEKKVSQEAAMAALSGFYIPMQKEQMAGYPDKYKCGEILCFVYGYSKSTYNETESEPTTVLIQEDAIPKTGVSAATIIAYISGIIGYSILGTLGYFVFCGPTAVDIPVISDTVVKLFAICFCLLIIISPLAGMIGYVNALDKKKKERTIAGWGAIIGISLIFLLVGTVLILNHS